MRHLTAFNRGEIVQWARGDAKAQGGSLPEPSFGLKDHQRNSVRPPWELKDEGKQWTYFDHAYFLRGWERGNFRCCRNNLHLTHLLDRPTDRIDRWGVKIEPWRKTGREIVIIPPSEYQMLYYRDPHWLTRTESLLDRITDRPVLCKRGKHSSLREFCRDAWAVVTFASVAGVEAALMGIPVFSTENCPSWPVNSGPLERIETPDYPDCRLEMAASLTYASWNVEEMRRVKWVDYMYEVQ